MRQIKAIAAVVMAVALSHGCIFEDRSDCPSFLTLDFSRTPEDISDIHLVITTADKRIIRDTIDRNEFMVPYEVSVRRGETGIAAFGNIDRMIYGNGYRVAEGEDADNLYTCFIKSVYRGDLSSEKVTVLKNNIGLHVRVLGSSSDSLHIEVVSSSTGYDLQGHIMEGIFRHLPDAIHTPSDKEAYFEFLTRVTRQKDDDLTLSVYTGSGKEITSICLLPLLTDAGIDMDDEILQDLYITVDVALSCLTVSPEDWNHTGHTEIFF